MTILRYYVKVYATQINSRSIIEQGLPYTKYLICCEARTLWSWPPMSCCERGCENRKLYEIPVCFDDERKGRKSIFSPDGAAQLWNDCMNLDMWMGEWQRTVTWMTKNSDVNEWMCGIFVFVEETKIWNSKLKTKLW